MSSGYQKPGRLDQLDDGDEPDEPATPDGNPCRIQDHVRVAQGARRNPLLYGSHAGLQQVQAPDPRSRTCMRFDIPDRIPRIWSRNLLGFHTDNLHQCSTAARSLSEDSFLETKPATQ